MVLLVMTWCAGESLPERFETARAFYVACHQRRRRPGKTFAGFEKALGKVPLPVLRAVAGAVRQRLARVFAERFRVDGWIPLGCDGSRLACPRSRELERRLGGGAKKRKRRKKKTAPAVAPAPALGPSPDPTEPSKKPKTGPEAPQLWVTAVVHLGLGVLWSWHRLPKKTAGKFYRWRWRNEGLFRTYKRTLGKVKLMSRTVAKAHREAEGSLLATQLLLAQGALALQTTAAAQIGLPSARKVLVEIRVEIRDITGMYLGPRQRQTYLQRLAQARWRERRQLSGKVRRRWPGRKDHKPPGRPTILKRGTILKDKMQKTLATAQGLTCS